MPKRFRFLRFIGFMLRLFAGICLLAGLAGGAVLLASGNHPQILGFKFTIPTAAMWAISLLPMLYGLFCFTLLYAAGGLLSLLLATEENTRAAALGLSNMRAAAARPATAAPPALSAPSTSPPSSAPPAA